MKTLFLLPILLLLGNLSSAQTFKDAVEYNDYIVELQNEIGYKIIAFNNKLGEEESTMEGVQPFYDDLIVTSKGCLTKLENLKAFENDASLKPAAENLFRFYVRCFSSSYYEMLQVIFKPELLEEDYLRLSNLMEEIATEEAVYDQAFTEAQLGFAEKYNFSLDRNELQDQIDE